MEWAISSPISMCESYAVHCERTHFLWESTAKWVTTLDSFMNVLEHSSVMDCSSPAWMDRVALG